MDDLNLYLGKPSTDIYVNPELVADRRNAYALPIEGDGLAPKYKDGDIVLVDPDKKAAPGDYVIIGKKGWNSEAAILVNEGEYLTVRNGTSPAPFLSLGTTILGVIVCALADGDYYRSDEDDR